METAGRKSDGSKSGGERPYSPPWLRRLTTLERHKLIRLIGEGVHAAQIDREMRLGRRGKISDHGLRVFVQRRRRFAGLPPAKVGRPAKAGKRRDDVVSQFDVPTWAEIDISVRAEIAKLLRTRGLNWHGNIAVGLAAIGLCAHVNASESVASLNQGGRQ